MGKIRYVRHSASRCLGKSRFGDTSLEDFSFEEALLSRFCIDPRTCKITVSRVVGVCGGGGGGSQMYI